MIQRMIKPVAIYLTFALSLPLQAQEFGRLFTTPTQRSQLDNLRLSSKLPSAQAPEEASDTQPSPIMTIPNEPPAEVSVQGYVKRSDGKKGTVWVNNTPMQESTKNSDFQVGKLKSNSNRVDINIPANNTRVRLKAGQVYDTETNSVVEANVHAKQLAERQSRQQAEDNNNKNLSDESDAEEAEQQGQ